MPQDLTSGTESVVSVQTPIATFTRVANEITSKPALLAEVSRPHLGTYPPPEVTQLLSRAYKLTSYNWSALGTTGAYHFPHDLFTAANLMTQLMTNFLFFRAKAVEITMKLSSTPYYQGALLVGWIPDTTSAVTAPTLQQLSNTPCVVLSASKQDSAVITIPWLSAVDYCRLNEAAPHELGSLFIRPLVQLVAPSGATDSLELTMYAKFIEPTVMGYTKQSSNKHRFNAESAKKDKEGIDAQSIVSSVSKVARSVPIIGDIWSPIADVLNSISGDLSKPTSNQAYTKVLMSSNENYCLAGGEFFGNPFSLYPNAQMEQGKTMYGMETSHMTVSELAQRPSLFDLWTINSVTPTWSTVVDIYGGPQILPGTYYNRYVANAHARWRGSMKYLFYFCCNAFHATKVRITLTYGSRVGIARNDDVPYQIVDVKGDTWHAVTVPYMRQFPWTTARDQSNAPTLSVTLESPITGDHLPATPTVYLVVFRASGEDVQFSRLGNAYIPALTKNLKERTGLHSVIKQTSFQERFKKTFDPIVPGCNFTTETGFTNSETTQTVSDCLKRFGNIDPQVHNGIQYYTLPEHLGDGATVLEPYHYFACLFRYFRGSRRLVLMERDPSTTRWYGMIIRPQNSGPLDQNFQAAGWGIQPYQQSIANGGPYSRTLRDAFEIPWYSTLPYSANTRISVAYPGYPDDVQVPTGSPPMLDFLVAGGDDFVALHLLWPLDHESGVEAVSTQRSSNTVDL